MQRRKRKKNARMRGKKSYLARRRWLTTFLAVLWRWLVAKAGGGVLAHGRRLQAAATVLCFFSVFP